MSAAVTPFVLAAGVRLRFEYPAANYLGVPPRWEPRQVFVERVRVLDAEPLDPLTIPRNPLLDRGRVLVTGRDIDKGEERSFYVESMREVQVVECFDPPKLPPLYVTVEREGQAVRTIEFRDPRAYFCEHWSDLNSGTEAFPV